jgi:hypothetical protein
VRKVMYCGLHKSGEFYWPIQKVSTFQETRTLELIASVYVTFGRKYNIFSRFWIIFGKGLVHISTGTPTTVAKVSRGFLSLSTGKPEETSSFASCCVLVT